MGYALFAQRKVMLTGQLNMVQLQQTQRSNEQYLLATQTLSLQQQLSSMQSSQALELADYYELLAAVGTTGIDKSELPKDKKYGEKAQAIINKTYQDKGDQSAAELCRQDINDEIKKLEQKQKAELDEINRKIYLVSVKENAIEMQVKSLDTQVSAIQKQLEAVEEAEGSAIDRATPKFKGVG